jgi:TonB-linked SusC/RagA family outer membrane protein
MRKIVSLLTLLLLFTITAWCQGKISGTVRDQNGDIVPFATINVKGTKVSVAADANANFSIPAKSGDVLTISAVGVQTTQVTVGNSPTISVVMTRTTGNITDVVVTTALGVQRQAKSLGYATTKISSSQLNEAKVTNVASGLSGKVSGLTVNLVNNGVKPDVRVTLRGVRSFLGNNQALLVVDGNILNIRYLPSINPNDIQDVTILKGSSASALYGSDGYNGVIIITTKKGRGPAKITVSSTVTQEQVAYTAKFQNRFGPNGGELNPAQYPGVFYFPNDPFKPYVPYENQNYGAEYNGATVPLGAPVQVVNADGTVDTIQKYETYSAKPNAKKDFFNKGLTVQNDVTYSIGDEHSAFLLSFQDLDAKGTIPKDVNHRNTFRIDGYRETGKFRADYNISYASTHTNTTPGSYVPFRWGESGFTGNYVINNGLPTASGGSYFQGRPVYWTVINSPSFIDLRDFKDWQNDPFASPNGYFNAYYGNPWWQIDQTRLDEKNSDIIGSASLTYKPTTWASISYRFGLARNDYSNSYTKAGFTFSPYAISDVYGEGNIPFSVNKLDPNSGTGSSTNTEITSDLLASFHKAFGNFDVSLLLGNQVQDKNFQEISLSANALVIPDFYNIANNRTGEPNVTQFQSRYRKYSAFGDLTVGYKQFVFLHLTGRNDWDSRLAKANRSYFYPEADASFVFSELLKNNGPAWLSYGKVHAAVSQVGQVNIQPYSLVTAFDPGGGFPFGSTAGYTIENTYANPNLKPEKNLEREVGIELGFLKDRITFAVSAYQSNAKDQTIPVSISWTTGFNQANVNSGEMQNKGIELDLKVTPVLTKDIRWDISGNFSYNQNKVLNIGYGLNEIQILNNTYIEIGKPYGEIKGSDWNRDPEGRIIVDSKTGFPTLNATPKLFGTAYAPRSMGINTTFSYKGLTLGVVAEGRFGAVINNDLGQDLDFTGVSWYSAQTGRQAFVIPNSSYLVGDKYVPNTNISVTDGNNGFWASAWNSAASPYVNSADFWKLREVSLTYTLPQTIVAKTRFIKEASIGVVGRNLAAIRADQNVWSDPEYSNTSGNGLGTTDINQTPPSRFYGGTITLTF